MQTEAADSITAQPAADNQKCQAARAMLAALEALERRIAQGNFPIRLDKTRAAIAVAKAAGIKTEG